jgi:hypothetical protein
VKFTIAESPRVPTDVTPQRRLGSGVANFLREAHGGERSRVIFQLIMGHEEFLHKFVEVSSPEAFQDGLRPQY